MFCGEAGNVLPKATVKLTVLFFVISAGLYLGYIWQTGGSKIEQPQTLSLSAVSGKEKAKPVVNDATKKSEAVKKEVEKKAEAPAKK